IHESPARGHHFHGNTAGSGPRPEAAEVPPARADAAAGSYEPRHPRTAHRICKPVMRFLKVTRLAPTLLSSSLVVASSMTAAAQTSVPQRAAWVSKEVHFVFQGFTTKYSCDGLQSKIRNALLQLGARKDLRVDEGACPSPTGGPEPFPSVNVKLSVLQPLANNKEDASAVLAHWKAIDLRLDKDPLWQAEDCE